MHLHAHKIDSYQDMLRQIPLSKDDTNIFLQSDGHTHIYNKIKIKKIDQKVFGVMY